MFVALPDGHEISDARGRLDYAAIHAYLTRGYWAEGIDPGSVRACADNALPKASIRAASGRAPTMRCRSAFTDRTERRSAMRG